jgi:hypothetical protein
MTSDITEHEADLERQRAGIEAIFRNGWTATNTERRPFISRVSDDVDVIITGSGAQRRVAVLFTHQDFPGAHFGHRFPEPWTGAAQHASIWLMEEIETKALHRMMRNQPPTDDAGIIWTTWGDG